MEKLVEHIKQLISCYKHGKGERGEEIMEFVESFLKKSGRMAKYEPKTCIKCKHRVFTNIYINERKNHYYCWENPEIRDGSDGARKYKMARNVSGRHLKCKKYERRKK